MSILNYIEILLCCFLLSFLIWKELKRKNKRRLIIRIVVSFLAVVSLACIVLPISFNAKNNRESKEALILTEGYNKDSLASASYKDMKTYSVNDYLYEKPNDINVAQVFGYGFSKDETSELPEGNYVFHATDIETGINSVSWQHQLSPGEKLQVQGNFNNKSDKKIKLVLSLFNTSLDSVTPLPQQQSEFHLQTIPKQTGRAVYKLFVISEKDTLEQEPVPVEIISPQSLKILMLASSPDFENKFLINWLSQNKDQVALRTTISTNKFDITYLGVPHISLQKISPVLLDNFDLLIADAIELQSMNSNELAFIQSSIENKELGLIIRADSLSEKNIFYNRLFHLNYSKNDSAKMSRVYIGNDSSLTNVYSALPAHIDYKNGMQPLVKDEHSKIVAANVLFGAGKIICTTLPNTFSWSLSGNKNSYDNYWTLLLQSAAKRNAASFEFNIDPVFPRVNERAEINLQTSDTVLPNVQIENVHVSFIQNSILPSQWKGSYWSMKEGWQKAVNAKDMAWFYAYNKNEWKNIYANEKIERTKKFISLSHIKNDSDKSENTSIEKAVPKAIFYFLFLASCLFLWIERKL